MSSNTIDLLQDSPQRIRIDKRQNLEDKQEEETVVRKDLSKHVPKIANIWSVVVDAEAGNK